MATKEQRANVQAARDVQEWYEKMPESADRAIGEWIGDIVIEFWEGNAEEAGMSEEERDGIVDGPLGIVGELDRWLANNPEE